MFDQLFPAVYIGDAQAHRSVYLLPQEVLRQKPICRSPDHVIRHPGSVGDVQERVGAVRLVQDPEQREFGGAPLARAAGCSVEPTPPELGLTHGALVQVDTVALEDAKDQEAAVERIGEALRPDEGQVVVGGVVLGEPPWGVRDRPPTDRLMPGEQYWRSS